MGRAYAKLASLIDRYDNPQPFGLSLDEWKSQCNLYAFDFTGDLAHDDNFHLLSGGSLTLSLRFGAGLPQSTIVVIYQEFDELVQIDFSRKVTMIGSAL